MYFEDRLSFNLLDGSPNGFSKSLVDPQDPVVRVLETDHGGRQVEEDPELGLLPSKRVLDLLAFRDITGDARQANQFACGISDLKTTVENPSHGSIRTSDSILNAHLWYISHQSGEHGPDSRAFHREDSFHPLLRAGIQTLGRPAPGQFKTRADVMDLFPVGRSDPEYVGDVVRQLAEFCLAFAQRFFRSSSLGIFCPQRFVGLCQF